MNCANQQGTNETLLPQAFEMELSGATVKARKHALVRNFLQSIIGVRNREDSSYAALRHIFPFEERLANAIHWIGCQVRVVQAAGARG